jgi:2-oxoglutarate dehydrogenase E2 component (dihydrolipoamide succinyltransferase)
MTTVEVILPAMGEGITDATITKWLVEEGDTVEEDQPLVEIATDKVDSEIPAPASGTIKKIMSKEGEIPKVGEVLAVITADKEVDEPDQPPADVENLQDNEEEIQPHPEMEQPEEEIIYEQPNPVLSNKIKFSLQNRYISPFIRNLAKANNISIEELSNIPGSGANGTLTKHDVLDYMNRRLTSGISHNETGEPSSMGHYPAMEVHTSSGKTKKSNGSSENPRVEIIEMDRMRKLIAEHMVKSVLTSPHVTSFVEADLTNLVQWRNQMKGEFLEKYQEKLTYTPLLIEAVAKALKDFPLINVSVDQDKILVKKDINVGMATALTNGNLIVPVIKNADQLTLQGLAAEVNDLAKRARENKLKPAEVKGGTFSITNLGSFGNISGTPIINQPEVAILAAGAILRKPAVVKTEHGESIGIRDIMILSLTYDHRVVDGSLGGIFLKRVAEYLENFDVTRKI